MEARIDQRQGLAALQLLLAMQHPALDLGELRVGETPHEHFQGPDLDEDAQLDQAL